jgi:hypothetical protein
MAIQLFIVLTAKKWCNMLHLLQIINHMLTTLEYTVPEVEQHLKAVESREVTLAEFLDVVGVEVPTAIGLERLQSCIDRGVWRSALRVTELRIRG